MWSKVSVPYFCQIQAKISKTNINCNARMLKKGCFWSEFMQSCVHKYIQRGILFCVNRLTKTRRCFNRYLARIAWLHLMAFC